MESYHAFAAIAKDEGLSEASGIRIRRSAFFFPFRLEGNKSEYDKYQEIMRSGVQGLRRDRGIIEELGINAECGFLDAYELLAPVIDTDRATHWLTNLVREKGADLVTRNIDADLLDLEDELLGEFRADAIVNATGLASSLTASDNTSYPLRGALLRIINDGSDFPKLDTAVAISADVSEQPGEIVFLVPRSEDVLVMGGISEPHEDRLDFSADDDRIQTMRKRCEEVLPCLKSARLVPEYPLAQGLRPTTEKNVRLEREARRKRSRIVHSYGHGGSGWSLSIGCAFDVVDIVGKMVKNGDVEKV